MRSAVAQSLAARAFWRSAIRRSISASAVAPLLAYSRPSTPASSPNRPSANAHSSFDGAVSAVRLELMSFARSNSAESASAVFRSSSIASMNLSWYVSSLRRTAFSPSRSPGFAWASRNPRFPRQLYRRSSEARHWPMTSSL